MKDMFNNETVRALGLYQPFAALMAFGKVETRFVRHGRKAPFPLGKYMLYSCQKSYDVSDGALQDLCTREQEERIEELQYENDFLFCAFGEPMFIADLVKIIDPLTEDVENTWVKFVPETVVQRRVGLVFENVKQIKPFLFRGKQGIKFLTDKEKSEIEFV
jgi:hypothetical protein